MLFIIWLVERFVVSVDYRDLCWSLRRYQTRTAKTTSLFHLVLPACGPLCDCFLLQRPQVGQKALQDA